MKKVLDTTTVVLILLVSCVSILLAARGLLGPQAASARFGIAVQDAAGTLFYRVYLSRNLVIIGSALILLLMGQWRGVAIVLTAAALLPVFDMAVLVNEYGNSAPLTLHIVFLIVLWLLAALSWRRVLQTAA